MSACPSFSLSCDNNHWNCCGSAKEPDQHGDGSFPKQQQQPAAPHPPPTQPPTSVVAPPPSGPVPPHHVSSPVAPCNHKAHEPPVPAATPIPAAMPPKRHEPTQPARTAATPRDEPSATPIPITVSSNRYEPPQPAWSTVTLRTPVPPNEPRLRPAAPPPARTAWPSRAPSKTYDDGGVQAVTTMRPPLPHRIYEAPAPAVVPLQPATSTPPGARASQYPPAHHPQHQDTSSRMESYSQAY